MTSPFIPTGGNGSHDSNETMLSTSLLSDDDTVNVKEIECCKGCHKKQDKIFDREEENSELRREIEELKCEKLEQERTIEKLTADVEQAVLLKNMFEEENNRNRERANTLQDNLQTNELKLALRGIPLNTVLSMGDDDRRFCHCFRGTYLTSRTASSLSSRLRKFTWLSARVALSSLSFFPLRRVNCPKLQPQHGVSLGARETELAVLLVHEYFTRRRLVRRASYDFNYFVRVLSGTGKEQAHRAGREDEPSQNEEAEPSRQRWQAEEAEVLYDEEAKANEYSLGGHGNRSYFGFGRRKTITGKAGWRWRNVN
ncbi:hypothetical protein THAOC_05421 [Thalassiosira oceanica]|uniref:Uncharacterized protein n=1 Tax=Thalassiosira oceanica TaxID=159749 RepID=K0TMU3_THAOC|nr:hypothetical protein THAOC_05421 [Thalassiosira oceanica]|eukprot:EJK72987.1 hypothetical protein THAOC_05421 [Thalassiosira oceanica]